MGRSPTSGILSPGTVTFHKLALTSSLTIALLSPISLGAASAKGGGFKGWPQHFNL